MREYMKNKPHEIDDDLDLSIELHSPSKGEPGYQKPILTREKIIDVIATEIQCSELMFQYDDLTRTVKGLVWATRVYDALEKEGAF